MLAMDTNSYIFAANSIKKFTSGTGLLGDRRSVTLGLTLGLLSFEILLAWLKEDTESVSIVVVLSWRTARGETL